MHRDSVAKNADVRFHAVERGPDHSGAGHSRGLPLDLEEELAVAGGGGPDIREGTRKLECY